MTEQTRFDLPQDRMPTSWFNIMPSIVQAGMQPLPPLHPATHEPVGPADLLVSLHGSIVPCTADGFGGGPSADHPAINNRDCSLSVGFPI